MSPAVVMRQGSFNFLKIFKCRKKLLCGYNPKTVIFRHTKYDFFIKSSNKSDELVRGVDKKICISYLPNKRHIAFSEEGGAVLVIDLDEIDINADI